VTVAAAHGVSALFGNTIGLRNTAVGSNALVDNTSGNNNTAVGFKALQQGTGSGNIAVGRKAGSLLVSGSQNIYEVEN